MLREVTLPLLMCIHLKNNNRSHCPQLFKVKPNQMYPFRAQKIFLGHYRAVPSQSTLMFLGLINYLGPVRAVGKLVGQ
jgi:hypothetical protein